VTTPQKLGYLIPQFPGQTHIFFWREIQALEAHGVEVELFSTRLPPKGLISHDWSDQAIGRTRYLGAPRPLASPIALARLPFGKLRHDLRKEGPTLKKDLLICAEPARRLAAMCHARDINHIHIHSCGRAALIAALARLAGGPSYSLTLHGPLSDYGPGQGLKWRHAAFATVITRKLRVEIETQIGDDLPENIALQPMGVDVETLTRDAPYKPLGKSEPLRLFACGRLNVVKGHQDLLVAVRLLLDQGVDLQLEIAGEDDDGGGGYHRVLQARLEELGLTGKARLLGAISSDEIRKKLQNAHIFVLASWHEPLGVAYMEAMSCGVPVIGTNAGGVPELITHGETGMMVPPKSPEALADAILSLAQNPALATKLSTTGRAHIVKNYRSDLGAETLLREIAKL
jgi:glycosyltransferase involved in cell wall biosynthesis